MKKIFKTLALVLATTLVLTSCGDKKGDTPALEGKATIKIGATATPHAVILERIKDDLAKKDIILEIEEFSSWELLNQAVNDGQLDANFFQHEPFLLDQVKENGFDLVSIGTVHTEPLGIYSDSQKNFDNIPDGAIVTIPNDSTNGGRALKLLEAEGLITFPEGTDFSVTKYDIVDNPHNIDIQEQAAEFLTKTLADAEFSVINGNYALDAGYFPLTSALALEDKDSPYANVIAVKTENKDNPEFAILMETLQTKVVADFITQTFQGSVVSSY